MLGRNVILMDSSISIGEFDPDKDGAYDNVKTFPLNAKRGKLSISVHSDNPVDVAVSDSGGTCMKFKRSVVDDTIVLELRKKETLALVIGIFRGDKAKLRLKAWME
ncbi:MAG: hypothetical protein FWD92_06995 [Methanomassiliicoccaceae archaeon]|nr:hypothetical protein [Methanomassiliicoccaceae archaeon]